VQRIELTKQMMAGMKRKVPKGSNCLKRSVKPMEFSSFLGGEVKKRAMPRIVTAPIGKFI